MSVTVMLGGNIDAISSAIETGISFSKRLRTNLTGLCALPDPANAAVFVTGAETVVLGASAIASMAEAQEKLANDLEQSFSEQLESDGAGLVADFERVTGSVALHGAVRASLSDAFIVPKQATHSNHVLNPVFEHVLMETHLPLILAPSVASASDTCMIAWDGSPLAARAVRAHLPLIATYKKVVIAMNASKISHQWSLACDPLTDALIGILRDQRLEVQTMNLDGAISGSLVQACQAHQVSLLVMGAYGHARLGQMLFGGTTSKLLTSDAAPALALCH